MVPLQFHVEYEYMAVIFKKISYIKLNYAKHDPNNH